IAKAMVTRRIKPMLIDGKKTYQIGIPIHWGYRGIAEDAGKTSKTPVNMLSPTVIDPNAHTPEFKGFLVKVERASAKRNEPGHAAHPKNLGTLRPRARPWNAARRNGLQARGYDHLHRLQGVRGRPRRGES